MLPVQTSEFGRIRVRATTHFQLFANDIVCCSCVTVLSYVQVHLVGLVSYPKRPRLEHLLLSAYSEAALSALFAQCVGLNIIPCEVVADRCELFHAALP